MTEIENLIMDTMLKNITQNKNVSLKELAKQCHVADSTIVKLSKKLGYSGYIEMYYHYFLHFPAPKVARTQILY